MAGKVFRIGVVCEGSTDLCAIRHFITSQLKKNGIEVSVKAIQPTSDNTSVGGWSAVQQWLESNGPAQRQWRYLSAGIFENDLDNLNCDAILLHIDSDILNEPGFVKRVKEKYAYSVPTLSRKTVRDQKNFATKVLKLWAQFDTMPTGLASKHVFSPAVKNTEAWCVAAFKRWDFDVEGLDLIALATNFGEVLARSESRSSDSIYRNTNKNVDRRERYCRKHSLNSHFVYAQCLCFKDTIDQISKICAIEPLA